MISILFFSSRTGRWYALAAGFLGLAAPTALHAQGSGAATPAPALARVSGKEYMLAHSSAFNAPPTNARNPFWPIGWTPSAVVAQQAVVLNVKPEDFVVTTISMDAPALAVVNGKTRGVGDQIPVSADGRDFVMVKAILDGVVVLDYHGREVRSRNDGGGLPRKTPGK